MPGLISPAQIARPTRHGLQRSMLAYRWLTLVWIAGFFGWEVYRRGSDLSPASDPSVSHPYVGFFLLGAALAVTAIFTELFQRNADHLLQPVVVFSEITVASTLLFADVWVYGTSDHAQALPSMWVLAAVVAVALAAGQKAATITGVGLGVARYVGWLLFDGTNSLASGRVGTVVLLGIFGWVVGYVLSKLAEANASISSYRAREEVARTLHDGVLQTLAVIQRRSADDQLIKLARSQEFELREYLFGRDGEPSTSSGQTESTGVVSSQPGKSPSRVENLAVGLLAAARRAEDRYEFRVHVVTAPDLVNPDSEVIDAICGAVGEAMANAYKHGEASNINIYAEPVDDEETVFVAVKDDGCGFDGQATAKGQGLTRSIIGRIEDVGGRVEIDGRLGSGTEVRMWV